MNSLTFTANMMRSSERLRFRDWCCLLAADYQREALKAGRDYMPTKRELRTHLVGEVKDNWQYRAVPTWLITIFVNLVLQWVWEWLQEWWESRRELGHA